MKLTSTALALVLRSGLVTAQEPNLFQLSVEVESKDNAKPVTGNRS